MKKLLIIILTVTIGRTVFAETLCLKDGSRIQGIIVEKTEEYLKLDTGIGVPVSYYYEELESIVEEDGKVHTFNNNTSFEVETKSKEQQQVTTTYSSRIETHYGVKYDLTQMEQEYEPSELIIAVANITLKFDIQIEGVKVIERGLFWNFARVVKTASKDSQGNEQPRRYVLMLSPDLAYKSKKIIEVLKGIGDQSFQEKQRHQVDQVREETMASVFNGGELSSDEKSKISGKIARASGVLLEGLHDKMMGEDLNQKRKGNLNITPEDHYLSFAELFVADQRTEVRASEIEEKQHPQEQQPQEKKQGVFKTYYDNGAIYGEYPYLDGKLDGMSREYYISGEVKKEVEYKEGLEHGLYKEYYANGKSKIEAQYDLGKRIKSYAEYYPDSKKKYVEHYKNGNVDGVVLEYYENGNLKSEIDYQDGVVHGFVKEYNLAGNLVSKFSLQNNIKSGPSRIYYPSGELFKVVYYQNDIENGPYREYYQNGNLKLEVNYRNGQRSGAYREFAENGQLVYVENYQNGKVDGLVQEYYDNGKLKYETTFVNNHQTGIMRQFNEEGVLVSEAEYKDGRQEGFLREYYDDGQLKVDGVIENNQLKDMKVYDQQGNLVENQDSDE